MKPQFLLLLVSLALFACSSRLATHVFLLGSAPLRPAPALTSGADTRRLVVLRSVILVDYLDTTDILVRTSEHEVKALAGAQWAERLSKGITHALRAKLEVQRPGDIITSDSPTDDPAVQILVNINGLDTWPDGRCVLVASWTILTDSKQPAPAMHQEIFLTEARGPASVSDAGVVAAIAATVDKLGTAIALSAN